MLDMKEILFNKYEIIRLLGKGGQACVFLVKDLHLNELRALKRIEKKDEVEIELKTLKSHIHPGLPIIYDYRSDENYSYIFMEYVEGITLREYIDNGNNDINSKIEIVSQIIEIISYLHNLKPQIIYRDLKPDNIILRLDGKVKLVDFGAVLLRNYSINKEDGAYGTHGYSAPEVFKGRKITESADIYSIGAIMHEMFSSVNPNKPPFLRKPLRDYDKAIPKGLEKIVNRSLDENAEKRYQNTSEIKDALKDYDKLFIGKEILFILRKVVVYGLFVLAFFMAVLPLYKGVKKNPDNIAMYLCKPIGLLLAGCFANKILLSGKKFRKIIVEKDVMLTEKKYIGLLAMAIWGIIISSLMIVKLLSGQSAYAIEGVSDLKVNIYDENERKLLIKNDALLDVNDFLRIEVPAKELPEGVSEVRITANSNDGLMLSSRAFKVVRANDLYTK